MKPQYVRSKKSFRKKGLNQKRSKKICVGLWLKGSFGRSSTNLYSSSPETPSLEVSSHISDEISGQWMWWGLLWMALSDAYWRQRYIAVRGRLTMSNWVVIQSYSHSMGVLCNALSRYRAMQVGHQFHWRRSSIFLNVSMPQTSPLVEKRALPYHIISHPQKA